MPDDGACNNAGEGVGGQYGRGHRLGLGGIKLDANLEHVRKNRHNESREVEVCRAVSAPLLQLSRRGRRERNHIRLKHPIATVATMNG